MNSADVCEPRKSDSGEGWQALPCAGLEKSDSGRKKRDCARSTPTRAIPKYSTGSIRAKAPRRKRGDGARHGISGPRPREVMG